MRIAGVILASLVPLAGVACVALVGDFNLGSTGGAAGSPTTTTTTTTPCGAGAACLPGMTCSPSGCSDWTDWPMPNAAEIKDAGLPNLASYDTTKYPGVIIDKVTGLWWQHPVAVINDQGVSCDAGCAQADALTYCAHLTLAGVTGWRLPTRIELVSIVDYATRSPAINAVFASGTPSSEFWTSSPSEQNPTLAWNIGFGSGRVSSDNVTYLDAVRCVRSVSP